MSQLSPDSSCFAVPVKDCVCFHQFANLIAQFLFGLGILAGRSAFLHLGDDRCGQIPMSRFDPGHNVAIRVWLPKLGQNVTIQNELAHLRVGNSKPRMDRNMAKALFLSGFSRSGTILARALPRCIMINVFWLSMTGVTSLG